MRVERTTDVGEFVAAGPFPELLQRRLDAESEPFWSHAERVLFVARDGRRKVLGRLAAIVNRAHDARFHDGRGFFAWLVCPNDHSVAHELFRVSGNWLREHGCTHVRGPLHIGLGVELGALLEGFHPVSGALAPDNPSYLPALLQRLGLEVVHERHGYAWSREEVPPPPAALRREHAGEVVYRPVDPAQHGSEALRFLAAYNAANAERWGFVPVTADEAKARVRDLLAFGDPRLFWLAEVRGEPAGVAVALPVLETGLPAPAPGKPEGRLAALRALRESLRRRKLGRVQLLSVAVDPRFKDMHLGAQLLLRAWRAALDLGVGEAELDGIDADDEAMQHLLWRLGCRRVRRFGVFEGRL